MSTIRKIPFIESVLSGLSKGLLNNLKTILDSNESNVELGFGNLPNVNTITPTNFKLDVNNKKSGILIYTSDICVLIAYHRFQDLQLFKLNVSNSTYEKVNEYCDINELRRILDDSLETVGENILNIESSSGELEDSDIEALKLPNAAIEYNDTIYYKDTQDDNEIVFKALPRVDGNTTYLDVITIDLSDNTYTLLTSAIAAGEGFSPEYDTELSDSSTNAVQNKTIVEALEDYVEAEELEETLEYYAKKDGNYPTMTVGMADNLTPYDESAGDDQDEPFIFQATGTGNGSQADFATGSAALMKEKQGNTVVINQLVDSGTTEATTISGHKYLTIFSGVYAIVTSTGVAITINDDTTDKVIDLTQWFGSNDNIPADLLSHPENWYRYYQGSLAYNAGQIVNANSRYIKCIGRQQWDEEIESGTINDTTGQNESVAGIIRSKDYIHVVPNTNYYFRMTNSEYNNYFFYDKDFNYIGGLQSQRANNTFTTPANACYMRFRLSANYGTTYNNDITISIYYEGESGYDQYYAYEVLTNNDIGSEVLLAFDKKTPDGTIYRNTGEYTILGTETMDYGTWADGAITIRIEAGTTKTLNTATSKILCSKWANMRCVCDGDYNYFYFIGATSQFVDLTAFVIYITGEEIEFILATPTTESGTPFSENLVIDDFGSMEFAGTNRVPQGNLIFYPVDYKAFVDTLYDYTEGTSSDIQLKSDLSTAITAFLTGLTGYDATKTQVLKNVEGTLTWVDEEA